MKTELFIFLATKTEEKMLAGVIVGLLCVIVPAILRYIFRINDKNKNSEK